ncbi:tol-pal system-associated acyl-CoA thioesterase [Rhodovulum sp. MB263]|uniref:tol-pal system-associated acyl-CoA thioesterase n=1 Tax=Rhodovulum sp. (strain MB263) TaxID=308754 RepID=UPI0009B7947B|nr:tol-pal system-associated acyl-CoA thioesterase [Rhodovulum sp. MB263]ARC87986.1 tol-pal system-associated acyl-CoA thioesterase [Rhodovulum sp. MB263]
MTHRLTLRVYYEDTDLAGIVYYANYLKFIERARSEWVRGIGIDQLRLKAETGTVFAVRRVEADYLSPARFDDLLTVETDLLRLTPARLVLDQAVLRGGTRLFEARVTLAALGPGGRPVRLPAEFRRSLETGPAGPRADADVLAIPLKTR